MQRRGFLGISLGGIFGGKEAAEKVLTESLDISPKAPLKFPMAHFGIDRGDDDGDEKSNLLEKIAKWERIVHGELTDEDKWISKFEDMNPFLGIRLEVMSLKSVSPIMKFRMMEKRAEKIHQEINRRDAKVYLKNALKRLAKLK